MMRTSRARFFFILIIAIAFALIATVFFFYHQRVKGIEDAAARPLNSLNK